MMIFIPLYFNLMFLIALFQEEAATSFDDLGKLLLGGVSAAIVLAVGLTLVRFRMRDKKPPTSNFISISSSDGSSQMKTD